MAIFHNFFCKALPPALRYSKRALALLLCLMQLQAMAQSIKISGKVLDEKGEPLVGASVVVKGTTTGVMVGADGSYTIAALPAATLVISFVGYPNVEMPVNSQTTIDVTMSTEGQELEEIVVVGYGMVKRANMAGAVSSMSATELQDIPVANLSTALEGKLAGVKIGQSSGKPGASTSLQIRESSSYGAEENPLYVIDGIIRDKDAFDVLDPNEVESISILKDASAAVYGSRAAGGVVLVQTKRGRDGKTKVSYNGTLGLTESVNVTGMLSAYEHAKMLNDGYLVQRRDSKLDMFYAPDELSYFRDSIPGGGYNWLDDAWKMAMVTRHSLNVSGGTGKVKYFVGGAYYYQTGNFDDLYFNKYSLRSNVDVELFKGMTANFEFSANHRFDRTPMNPMDTSNDLMEETFRALLQNPKWIPPTIGGLPVYQNGVVDNNPYAIWANNEYKSNETNNLSYIASLRYTVPAVKGLSAMLQFSQTSSTGYGKTYFEQARGYNFKQSGSHAHIVRMDAPLDSIPSSLISGSKEYLEESTTLSSQYQLNAQLSYNRKIDLHEVSALLVCEVSESDTRRVGWRREGKQVIKSVDELYAFEEKDLILAPNIGESGSLGYVGRMNYSYGSKYISEFSFRYEASSKFSPSERWGFFPAGAVGWVVSEEDFFKRNVEFLDFMKVRATAGLLGNDGVRDFLWKYSFGSASGVLFGAQPTNGIEAKNAAFANPDISWQKTQSYDVGVDLKFLGNKVSFSVDGFYKYTYDILAAVTSTNPTTVGIPTSTNIRFNYGIMHAYGGEIELGYYNKIPVADVSYYVKGNFAWSEAMKLKVAQSPGAIGTWHDELKNNISNQPGAISTGIVRTNEDLNDIMMDNPNYVIGSTPLETGMLNFKDIRGSDGSEGPNGVFKYDIPEDRTVIAALTSAPYTYGVSVGMSWQGVKVDMTFSGAFGHNVFFDKGATTSPDPTHNVPAFWADHWTPETPNAAYPRAGGYPMEGENSTFWMRDGHHLRLTDLGVSYNLPPRWVEQFGMPQLRFFFNTKNLWTVINPFDYKDLNLSKYNGYPMTRTYNFGLNLNF
jgi:TonB-linked SusC/RagA family outer membrane protein